MKATLCHYFNSYNVCAFTDACYLNTSENFLLNNNWQKIIAYTFLLALHKCLCTDKWWKLAWEMYICCNNGTSQPMSSYFLGVVPRRLKTRLYLYDCECHIIVRQRPLIIQGMPNQEVRIVYLSDKCLSFINLRRLIVLKIL